MLITKKKHDAMMREVGRMVVTRDDTIMVLRHQLSTARAEAEANKADAERYRAKLKRDREYHRIARANVTGIPN